MNELDFSGKQVLVVGGSSGIGNGIAQAFRARGARVHVCGTRATAADYSLDEGSHLEGLDYAQLDVSDANAIENFKPSFDRLDVLVPCDKGQSGLQRLENRRRRIDQDAWPGVGGERHSRQRHRTRPGRHQDDQGDDIESETARERHRADTAEAAGNTGRHGGRRAVSGVAARLLHGRSNPCRGRRPHSVSHRNRIGFHRLAPRQVQGV